MIGRRNSSDWQGAPSSPLRGLLSACGNPRAADQSLLPQLAGLHRRDACSPTSPGERGITVTYETYASNDELARRLAQAQRPREGGRSGTSFDLIVPSDNFVTRFRNEGALTELDQEAFSGLDNLADVFRRAEFDPGNRFSIPWATGTTGIGYDTTVFDEPPGYDVFLTQEHAGRMTVLNEIRDAFGLALFSIGRDPNTTDPGGDRCCRRPADRDEVGHPGVRLDRLPRRPRRG